MSVLIKDMEMPKSCVSCRFYKRLGCELEDLVTNAVQGCPLTEVPTPHGRLIDADVLVKEIHNDWDDVIVWDESGPTTADAFERLVYEQPTIIEAEEGEEDEIDRR